MSPQRLVLAGLTRSLAVELGEHGITCNAVCPGYFETEFTAGFLQDASRGSIAGFHWAGGDSRATSQGWLSFSRRMITGQQIVVDGGFTISL
jgi:gluconate 5-dehydrogenase